MTEYFEVHERDSAARLGELRLADPLHTPALVDEVLTDAGSEWVESREDPEGSEDELTVPPGSARWGRTVNSSSEPSGFSRDSTHSLPASVSTSSISAGVWRGSARRSSPSRAALSRSWTSKYSVIPAAHLRWPA